MMTWTIADDYYVRAHELFPYQLGQVMENLNYALSYDAEHFGANMLMAKVYLEVLEELENAAIYFEIAMGINPRSDLLCREYFWLFIRKNELDSAAKMVKYVYELPEAHRSDVARMDALVNELRGDYDRSLELLDQAKMETYSNEFMRFLELEIKRVTEKRNMNQKMKAKVTSDEAPVSSEGKKLGGLLSTVRFW